MTPLPGPTTVHGAPLGGPGRRTLADALLAGAAAAVLSGLPSTAHALGTGGNPLQASLAAGALLLPRERRRGRLLAAAAVLHSGLSLGWALVLAAVLPARRRVLGGALAGAGIAAVDLGLVGRRVPPIRALPALPQLADHVAYGAVVGLLLAPGRGATTSVVSTRAVAARPERIFEFLSDLHNHWLLEDRFVELTALHGEGGPPTGGHVRLKGPLGITREARTRVLSAQPPDERGSASLRGRAEIGASTTGLVGWEIAGSNDGGSLVTLTAVVERAALLDRALLLLGRWWLQRTFDSALVNLERILAPTSSARREPTTSKRWTRWKRRATTALARSVVNPLVRRAVDRGIAPPGFALLETVGRRSGLPRRTPVGNGLKGDTFWIVAEHGRSAAYVRNIEADPRVRVKAGRRWRTGTALLLPEDDARERQRVIGRRLNAAMVRLMGTDLLTVRVDLDRLPDGKRSEEGKGRRVEIWMNPSCSKCQAATELLDQAGASYTVRYYLEDPPTAEELAAVLDRLGLEPWDVARMGEPVAHELGLASLPRERERWLAVLSAHPVLIQRPLITADDGTTVVGRSPEELRRVLPRAAG